MTTSTVASAAPWLSILIPVHNVERYLRECIESILPQLADDPGVEVLLLDDASPDGSAAIMRELAQQWPGRITLMRHEVNQGLSVARNTMIDAARGEYVWFIDSDDKLLGNCIATLRSVVQQHGPDVVLCDFSVWRAKTSLKHRLRGESHKRTFEGPARQLLGNRCQALAALLITGQLHAWSKISRRSLWGDDLRFPRDQCFEDSTAMPLVMLRANSFYYVDEPWVAYRQRADSALATMNLKKSIEQSFCLLPTKQALSGNRCANDPDVVLALAHQNARNLTGAVRFVSAMNGPDDVKRQALREIRDNFTASSPLSAEALSRLYISRGWWLRLRKFKRWLRVCEVS